MHRFLLRERILCPVRLFAVITPTLALLGHLLYPYGQWGYASDSGDRAWFPIVVITFVLAVLAWLALVLLYQTLRPFVNARPVLLQLAAVSMLLIPLTLQEVILGIVANANGISAQLGFDFISVSSLVGINIMVRVCVCPWQSLVAC